METIPSCKVRIPGAEAALKKGELILPKGFLYGPYVAASRSTPLHNH